MKVFNISEAKAHFSQLVRAAMAGDDVVIGRDNQPLLRLVPVKPLPGKRRPGSGKGQLLYMASDFDAPLDVFDEYVAK